MRRIVFLLLFIFTSCKQSQKDVVKLKINGMWDIYEMTYKNEDYKQNLLINAFTFYIDSNKVTIPETYNYENEEQDINSKWEIINNDTLLINCKNYAFRGKFKITFFKDYKNKLLGIELKSSNTFIKAYKVMQNFDTDGKHW